MVASFTNLYAKTFSGEWTVIEPCNAEKVGRFCIRLTINGVQTGFFNRSDLRSTSATERKALGLRNLDSSLSYRR